MINGYFFDSSLLFAFFHLQVLLHSLLNTTTFINLTVEPKLILNKYK